MTPIFVRYAAEHRDVCLTLFDANCPAFFAPSERTDYEEFLDRFGSEYYVATGDGRIVAAFGVSSGDAPDWQRLTWIIVDPAHQGRGFGRAIMTFARQLALARGARRIHIAASQHSAPFFACCGADEVARTADGWGLGMDRVDMEWEISSPRPDTPAR